MNKDKLKLSIIINHYKTPDVLKMCIDSATKYVAGIEHELIVTDSETERPVKEEITKLYPDVIFLEHKRNVGFSKIVNDAIDIAHGEMLFIINADIVFKNNESLEKMMRYLEENDDVGIVGPKLFNIDYSFQHTYFREYTPLTILSRRTFFSKTNIGKKEVCRFTYCEYGIIEEPKEVGWLMGSAYLVKKDVLEKFGKKVFDDRFFMYFEDVDLCRRMRALGYKVVYFPAAEFTHYHKRASHSGKGGFDILTNKMTRVHIVSYLKYIWKYKFK